MASRQISTGTPGAAQGGAYAKPDSKIVEGSTPEQQASTGNPTGGGKTSDISDTIGTPGGRKNAPQGGRWDQN